ncbi:MAG: histidinol-phosphatase [Clostridia bacterium]|nr:histidinol-phosphatase [Clostridia bacterium]
MTTADLHMHTTYCDGKNSPEEMIQSAINMGLKTVGLSGHSYTGIDDVFGMSMEKMQKYFNEVQELKIKYKDKIKVLCGIEQDSFAGFPALDFDYAIGSVHYVYKDGKYLGVDHSEQITKNNVENYYNGDYYAYAEDYYKQVAKVIKDTNADIIGHFDLVTKFNEGYKYFDEDNPRYVKAYKAAVDALIPYNKPFEINTGAISRGYRTTPYPNPSILKYIKEKGGKVILSSDSHNAQNIAFKFDEFKNLII